MLILSELSSGTVGGWEISGRMSLPERKVEMSVSRRKHSRAAGQTALCRLSAKQVPRPTHI